MPSCCSYFEMFIPMKVNINFDVTYAVAVFFPAFVWIRIYENSLHSGKLKLNWINAAAVEWIDKVFTSVISKYFFRSQIITIWWMTFANCVYTRYIFFLVHWKVQIHFFRAFCLNRMNIFHKLNRNMIFEFSEAIEMHYYFK